MKKIIHLSDLHIGYAHCLSHFNSVVTNLIFKKKPAKDYVVIITGDLVDDATRDGLYELALAEIRRLKQEGFTVLICPGNHDMGTGSMGDKQFVARFKATFLGDKDLAWPKLDVIGETAFIGLDTMAEELHWYDRMWAEGELGKDQMKALKDLLATAAVKSAKYRVIYMHHHPFAPRLLHGLKDSDKLEKVIAGKVDALLFGHNHDGKIWNGVWDIPRCYDAGSSTRKNIENPAKASPHRVIDLSRDAKDDYDGDFH